MKKLAFAALTAAALYGTAAYADSTTVIQRDSTPSVTIERDAPAVIEHRSVETTGTTGCKSKTVKKENDMGDTVTKHEEKCD